THHVARARLEIRTLELPRHQDLPRTRPERADSLPDERRGQYTTLAACPLRTHPLRSAPDVERRSKANVERSDHGRLPALAHTSCGARGAAEFQARGRIPPARRDYRAHDHGCLHRAWPAPGRGAEEPWRRRRGPRGLADVEPARAP